MRAFRRFIKKGLPTARELSKSTAADAAGPSLELHGVDLILDDRVERLAQ